ncbi:MAG: alpha-amylase family glycosyl hydrolase [Saprospiraceae bacterium]|nr:alpha-amylase family glycosyl hydrolase [Saprospiraceae bacterium]
MSRRSLSSHSDREDEAYQPRPYVELEHPEWSKNAVIYEVNIRQYTEEGTFRAFADHLPRLKELGVDILWLMPIHPIGLKNRKGSLGSYYAVKDYLAVNPEFGTMEDFKWLVAEIHRQGMYAILDWVANHSAWDNELTEEHPEWYARTRAGDFRPTPWYDWSDVIDFDYNVPGLRKYMTGALRFWVEEADIDGYRCDVAGFVPVGFWEKARSELETIKPVFMLAEWESRDLHRRAFDMTYAWSLYDLMHKITTGENEASDLHAYFAHHISAFPADAYRMTFVDNHDKNSWEGTPFTQFGEGLEACMVLTCTVDGMPLVYGGQEAGLNRMLSFFEKDALEWRRHRFFDMYKALFRLKKENRALWNGRWGGPMEQVVSDRPDAIISFLREKEGDRVFVLLNLSDQPVNVQLVGDVHAGDYRELFSGEKASFSGGDAIGMPAWGYRVFYS